MTGSAYYALRENRLLTGVSLRVRKRVYQRFVAHFGAAGSILDVGVTSERASQEANFLEKLHPYKDRITAAGIEDASFLEREFPGMRFRRLEPDRPLPFSDREFDVAFSHAVIEHVVDEEAGSCPAPR